jgi:peptidyl-prolyl cis-trans isomerase SurA
VLATGLLMVVAVSGLSACRTSPSVAAYVGGAQVTVSELDAAVAERLADPDIAAYVDGRPADLTQRVLTLLVQAEVHAAAAERYDVQVDDDEVRTRITELLGSDDPDQVYAQLAQQQGVGRDDVFETVRQRLVAQKIAEAEGQAEGLTEEGLRAAYDQARENATTTRLGYIAVPDQATATAVQAELTAAPQRYAEVAARFPGQFTLPAVEERSPDQVPGPLAQQAAAAKPGTGFTVAVPEAGGVIVGFIAPYPPFEDVRPELEQQAATAAVEAGAALVDDVRRDLGVRYNPRYKPDDWDVVEILDDTAAATR